jgi:hypothetical protein
MAHGRFSSSIFSLLGTAGGMTAVQIRLKTRTERVFPHHDKIRPGLKNCNINELSAIRKMNPE